MITRTGKVTIHSDGIVVEGFQYANVTREQAEIETMQWLMEQLKKYTRARMAEASRRVVTPT